MIYRQKEKNTIKMGKKFINSILFFIISCSLFAAENYYVKVDGTGDGSSWEKAMSAEKFALKLSSQSTLGSGDTFHLAAGTYHPMYDPFEVEHDGYANKDIFKVYYIQAPINIIGGYSKNPTDGEIPNPSINKTIISGDMNDDDIEGDQSTNNSDDLLTLFNIDLKEKGQCSFSGLTLTRTLGRRTTDTGAFKIGGYSGNTETGSFLILE